MLDALPVDVFVTVAPEPRLGAEQVHEIRAGLPSKAGSTVTVDEVARVLAILEREGFDHITAALFVPSLPDRFLRACIEGDGIHVGVTDGREFWVAGRVEWALSLHGRGPTS